MRYLLASLFVLTACYSPPTEDLPALSTPDPEDSESITVPKDDGMQILVDNNFVVAEFAVNIEVQAVRSASAFYFLPTEDSAIRVDEGASATLPSIQVEEGDVLFVSVSVHTLGTTYIDNRVTRVPDGAKTLTFSWSYSEAEGKPVLSVRFLSASGSSLGLPKAVRTRVVAVTSLLDGVVVDMSVLAGGRESHVTFQGVGFEPVVGRIPIDSEYFNLDGDITAEDGTLLSMFGENYNHCVTEGSSEDINIVMEWSEPDSYGYRNLIITILEGKEENTDEECRRTGSDV